jgi:hypothetical protein
MKKRELLSKVNSKEYIEDYKEGYTEATVPGRNLHRPSAERLHMITRGVIRNKCAGRNNVLMNHFKNYIISRPFLGLVPNNSDELFTAVHLLPNGSGRLDFDDGSDKPFPSRLDVLLGRDTSQFLL